MPPVDWMMLFNELGPLANWYARAAIGTILVFLAWWFPVLWRFFFSEEI